MAAANTIATATPGTSSSNRAHQPKDSFPALRATKNGEELNSSDPRLLSEAGQKKLPSLPSRQRKKGPAPLASFEDLSMDKTTSDSSSTDDRSTLPGIGEEIMELNSPNSPGARITALTVPASPRIRVSAASSSSAHDTDSKESTPDRELFIGHTKKDYCEEMSDVKTSTEELLDEEERIRRVREKAKRIETEKNEEALRVSENMRKQSTSSVISENLLPVASGHSSRLSSLGSIGSNARRSPSPHKMLLETSFCGSKPIQQPSIDLDDPPLSSAKLLDYTLESMDQIKPCFENTRELSQSPPSMVPPHWKNSPDTQPSSQSISRSVSSRSGTTETSTEKIVSPKKSQFQERREKIDTELSRIHQHSSPRRSTPERQPLTEHRSRMTEYQMSTADGRKKLKESSISPDGVFVSPKIGKKVLPPQVPDLKDLKKAGSSPAPIPPPLPTSNNNLSGNSIAPETGKHRSYNSTPSASPKLGRKYFGKKNKDGAGTESNGSTPSTSRKSSFSSLFRRGDVAMSPVTPDSPGSVTGRSKSPFSQLIKNARNEFRSRSRSRSRSKSRDRDLEDDTHDRRGVLSIFKPKKKKGDPDDNDGVDLKNMEQKPSEAIMNVEFTFKDQEKHFPPSEFDRPIRSPTKEEIQEPIISPQVKRQQLAEDKISETSTSYKEDFLKETSDSKIKEVTEKSNSYKSVIESLEERQKEIIDKSIIPDAKVQNEMELTANQKDPLKVAESTPVNKQLNELIAKNVLPEDDSRSESEKESEVEYYKKKQQLGIEDDHTVSSDLEIKKLVTNDYPEDEELPYVPTTLPLERSQVSYMVPVKDRAPTLKLIQAIDRPRSTTPILPSRIDQYRESLDNLECESDSEKIAITIPKKALISKNNLKQSSKSWEDFCHEGLKSPRTLRKEYRENSVQSGEDEVQPFAWTPTTSVAETPTSAETTSLESPKSWINFEEVPDMVMKPVRQIKTIQQKPTTASAQDNQRKHKLTQQKRVDVSKMNDSYHSPDLENCRRRLDSDNADDIIPAPLRSSASTPERDDSSEKSSDSERLGSQSSSEELTTIREKIAEIKKREDKQDLDDSSDLERLLAPVNDCIAKLSSLSVQGTDMLHADRKSPIPDNWADFLLPPQPGRRSRLSSLGSDAGSIGGGRSPSPSHMLLETSFCGSQPIDDPGFAEPNVPIAVARKMSGISLGDLSPLMPISDMGATSSLHHFHLSDRASIVR